MSLAVWSLLAADDFAFFSMFKSRNAVNSDRTK